VYISLQKQIGRFVNRLVIDNLKGQWMHEITTSRALKIIELNLDMQLYSC